MTDPILQVYLDEAAKRSGYYSWEHANQYAAMVPIIRAHARTLQELGWKPPVPPELKRAREIANEVTEGVDYRAGYHDNFPAVKAALIALREGMGDND